MRPKLYLVSCSANPLHAGHYAIYNHIEPRYYDTVMFEISNTHVDKKHNDFESKLRQFTDLGLPVVTTNGGTYLGKAEYLRFSIDKIPGCNNSSWLYDIVFCCGSDNYKKIYDLRYYLNSLQVFEQAMSQLTDMFCSFLVFERNGVKFEDLKDQIPDSLYAISKGAEGYVSLNISSTEIRQKQEVKETKESFLKKLSWRK